MRKVEYKHGRIYAKPQDIVDAWRVMSPFVKTAGDTVAIPPQYALGTAQHETDFVLDEVDTEPSGFVSLGIFQLSDEEAKEADLPNADLLDLQQATEVMCTVSASRVKALLESAAARADDSKEKALSGDLWAYLSIAHNQGLGAAQRSVQNYGMNWAAYCQRNVGTAQVIYNMTTNVEAKATAKIKLDFWLKVQAYGTDCITGGARWGEVK